jgi:protein-tyrosine phosphatase
MYNFAAAAPREEIVYGAARPGYTQAEVQAWLAFMGDRGIQRVCCLLPSRQLKRYSNLLSIYHQTFGAEQVCWAPLEDFRVADLGLLQTQILPFLAQADQQRQPVVVHCSGGVGRTGQVLTAWLIAGRGMAPAAAIATVRQTGRNPYEAMLAAPFQGRNPWAVQAELNRLWQQLQPTPRDYQD